MPEMFDVQAAQDMQRYGEHMMQIVDNSTAEIVVIARRDPETLVWTIETPGLDDITVPTAVDTATPRADVIYQMQLQAIARTDRADGYSTMVPHGLPERP